MFRLLSSVGFSVPASLNSPRGDGTQSVRGLQGQRLSLASLQVAIIAAQLRRGGAVLLSPSVDVSDKKHTKHKDTAKPFNNRRSQVITIHSAKSSPYGRLLLQVFGGACSKPHHRLLLLLRKGRRLCHIAVVSVAVSSSLV